MINKYSIPKKSVTDDGETFSSQLLIVECLCIVPYHFYFGAEAATAPIKIITEGRIDIPIDRSLAAKRLVRVFDKLSAMPALPTSL